MSQLNLLPLNGMKVFLALTVLILGTLISQAEIPDGLWNGKPWDPEKLHKAVAAEDPEALAELAFWIKHGWGDQPYDLERAAKLAQKSARKGNPYGQAILSRMFSVGEGLEVRSKKALRFAKSAADAGHPLGLKNLANIQYGLDGNNSDWLKLTRESVAGGCLIAMDNINKTHRFATYGEPRDMEKYYTNLVKIMTDIPVITNDTAAKVTEILPEDYRRIGITPEMISKAVARLETSMKCGTNGSQAELAAYYIRAGQPEQGVPLLIDAANSDDARAKNLLLYYLSNDSASKRAGVETQWSNYYLHGRDCYETTDQTRQTSLALSVAGRSYVTWFRKGYDKDATKAIEIGEQLIKNGDRPTDASFILGKAYFSEASRKKVDEKRGIAHLIVNSHRDELLTMQIATSYRNRKQLHRAGHLALAAAVDASQVDGGEKYKRILDGIREKLTPEQIKQAEELIAQNYPSADKFRQKALDTLIEYGDYPPGTKLSDFGAPYR